MNWLPLLAQTSSRTVFEFGRLQDDIDILVPGLVLIGILAYVVFMYRRDTRDLGRLVSLWLMSLRTLAFLGLFFIYLQPQWRNETQKTLNSRAVLLVDTSLSMETNDNDSSPSEPNRAQQVAAVLGEGKFLNELRRTHDVVVWRFDKDTSPVTTLPRLPGTDATESAAAPADAAAVNANPATKIDWQETLAPRGTETRLGEALRAVLNEERASPLSGIVVITDGQQNTGVDPQVAIGLANELGVPLYPVGVGTDRQPANVRVSRIEAPARAFPGDAYSVTGYFQAQGMDGQTLNVELWSRPDGGDTDDSAMRLEASSPIVLGAGGEETSVKFEITPGEVGRRTLVLRVKPPSDDRNREDNQREAAVEVVDRKTKVLLFAGAASREYQFLRNVLRRDKEVIVDVMLQTGKEGISQDAHEILEDFPATREELYAYDCIVAFDPDWRELDAKQIDLLDNWVGDEAGGMIVIAGPIQTDVWSQSPSMTKIRTLYPVEFYHRFAVVEDGHFGSDEPRPIRFDRAGVEAEFLWVTDNALSNSTAWTDFEGVYGYYDVRGEKPGATVYARFGKSGVGNELPVYFVGQYYGSGQVFYMGSGEMWRMRAENEAYFETFYTKLIRHVSQGRLLRGSHRGVLFTERDQYLPGNIVEVRAQLKNAQLEPLTLPQAQAQVIGPDGTVTGLALAADPSRAGAYRGQFTVRKEGSYRLELPLTDGDEKLTCPPIQVTIPNLERDHTRRNDTLLGEIARQTGGGYYVGLDEMLRPKETKTALATTLRDASRTLTLAATPDRIWDTTPMLALICGLLCLEWLTRRLVKLA